MSTIAAFDTAGRNTIPTRAIKSIFAEGCRLRQARRRFIDFLRHYRPRHFADALGISLSRPLPLWVYPWDGAPPGDLHTHGWRDTPDDCPDILTHFSPLGIPSVRIDEEFMWLERSIRSISEHGYRATEFGPAHALELRRHDHTSAYLLLDGNHRAGALVALGSLDSLEDGAIESSANKTSTAGPVSATTG